MDAIYESFWTPGPVRINKARIEHLESLGLDFKGKHVLETGCGGKGDFTQYLLGKGATVTLNDAREENIKYLLDKNNLDLSYNTWDLNYYTPSEHDKFDVIVSYGTLYHLHDPANFIKISGEMCKEFMILSTVVNDTFYDINTIIENKDRAYKQQSFSSDYGCRPSRQWVFDELSKHFKYVYFSTTQPDHEDFPKNWNGAKFSNSTKRSIFLASHVKLFDFSTLFSTNAPL